MAYNVAMLLTNFKRDDAVRFVTKATMELSTIVFSALAERCLDEVTLTPI